LVLLLLFWGWFIAVPGILKSGGGVSAGGERMVLEERGEGQVFRTRMVKGVFGIVLGAAVIFLNALK
jgi:hypothetical protein